MKSDRQNTKYIKSTEMSKQTKSVKVQIIKIEYKIGKELSKNN